MFIDACAIVALLSDEPEAGRVSNALASAQAPITSPVAVLEAALALARADKFNRPVATVAPLIRDFLNECGIEVRDLPPAADLTRLTLHAAHHYRHGRRGLNLGDCLHYACAKYFDIPILATGGEFSQTDLETVD
ncbi:MAG: type II toxin-antitoxin system VapC family toxin [Burkholderiaceae bacterium]|jgi:ribonuclease VapC|nr:type II toxin-antitoxin system VapC family toxin [Burkholderiaceae bacterium]